MHWAEQAAQTIIKRNPDKEEYVCAAGISPSGSVHIGNFRDIATSYFVCRALQKQGKRARLLFSWDELDRLRKIPVNAKEANPDMEQYIGYAYVDAPDPFGCCSSYAEHFEKEFEACLGRFGIQVDFRYQGQMYRSGAYREHIIHALKHRAEIANILDSFRTEKFTRAQKDDYYPVSIYCPACKKDNTTISSLSADCTKAQYTCACGHHGDFDFMTDTNCKLAWKIDWPMRWMHEGVDFEPGGKDHAAPTSSYNTSRIIADKVFGCQAPDFIGYEFIGIKGSTGKMSGSTGLNLTPKTLLNIYQPEVILWLYAKNEPNKAFNFCFDDEILRQYFEFDKMYNAVAEGTADERTRDIMYLSRVNDRKLDTVPMALLVALGSIVDFKPDMVETIFDKIGTPYSKEQFAERLELAKFWTEQCSPESLNHLLEAPNRAYYDALEESEQADIDQLYAYLSRPEEADLDALQTELYAIPKRNHPTDDQKELKKIQGKFFQNVYQLLIGKSRGPRLYLFLHAIERNDYLPLLDFKA